MPSIQLQHRKRHHRQPSYTATPIIPLHSCQEPPRRPHGHQQKLPWAAQMDVRADSLATDYLDNYAEPSKIVPFIPASKASLTVNGETIARRFTGRLCQAASGPSIWKCLMSRNQWSRNAFLSINWDVPGKALDTVENSTQIVITKLAHDHYFPTRRYMHIIGQAETGLINARHVYTLLKQRTGTYSALSKTIHLLARTTNHNPYRNPVHQPNPTQPNPTQPDLMIILLQGIRGTLAHHIKVSDANADPESGAKLPISCQCTRTKNQIGWTHILKGRFRHHWLQIHQLPTYIHRSRH
jgi:hypothetical protein